MAEDNDRRIPQHPTTAGIIGKPQDYITHQLDRFISSNDDVVGNIAFSLAVQSALRTVPEDISHDICVELKKMTDDQIARTYSLSAAQMMESEKNQTTKQIIDQSIIDGAFYKLIEARLQADSIETQQNFDYLEKNLSTNTGLVRQVFLAAISALSVSAFIWLTGLIK